MYVGAIGDLAVSGGGGMEIDKGGEVFDKGLKALFNDAIGELDMIGDILVLGGEKFSVFKISPNLSSLVKVGLLQGDLSLFSFS